MANLAEGEVSIMRRYIGTLNTLEAAIPASSDNLDTSEAAVWSRNQKEVFEREHLYDGWRERLCAFLGLPPGPGLKTNARMLIV